MSKEYIERGALIETLRGSALAKYPASFSMGLIAAADEAVNQPVADVVEVKHGRWEVRGGRRYCSACKERACVTRDMEDFWYTVGTNYCPNCGAKMDGGADNG